MVVKQFAQLGGKNTNPMEELKDFVTHNALKILLAFTAASALGTLFVAGVVLTVINLTSQYDAGLAPRFTAIVAGGLGIILASLIIFAAGIYFARANAHEDKEEIEKEKHKEIHSLEEAVLLLVREFIEDREFKRAHPKPAHQPHRPHAQHEHEYEHEDLKTNEQFETH